MWNIENARRFKGDSRRGIIWDCRDAQEPDETGFGLWLLIALGIIYQGFRRIMEK